MSHVGLGLGLAVEGDSCYEDVCILAITDVWTPFIFVLTLFCLPGAGTVEKRKWLKLRGRCCSVGRWELWPIITGESVPGRGLLHRQSLLSWQMVLRRAKLYGSLCAGLQTKLSLVNMIAGQQGKVFLNFIRELPYSFVHNETFLILDSVLECPNVPETRETTLSIMQPGQCLLQAE